MMRGGPHLAPLPSETRAPPFNLEAERALLGAILINNSALDRAEGLDAAHFYDSLHGQIFESLQQMIGKGQAATPITLRPYFEQHANVGSLTVPQYLGTLAGEATTIFSVVDYARTIRELSTRRALIVIGEDMVNDCYDAAIGIPPEDLIEETESRLLALVQDGPSSEQELPMAQAIQNALKRANDAHKKGGGLRGLSTGLADLDAKLGGLAPSDLIIIGGRPGSGKAQPLDAKVLLSDGTWKQMGDIRFGDSVASPDGALSRVSGVFPQGERQVYRITFSDGRSTECCDEHLWTIYYRDWDKPRTVPTSEVRRLLSRQRYQRRLWVDSVSGHFGHHEALPIDPWALGALIGDGQFSRLSFTNVSTHVLDKMRHAVGQDFELRQNSRDSISYTICVSGPTKRGGNRREHLNPIREHLRSLGLWGLKSHQKFIPPVYKTACRSARLELIRGLMDTDGWAESKGTPYFGSTSLQLATDFADLIRSIGGLVAMDIKYPHYTYKGVKKAGRPFYRCSISYAGDDPLVTEPRKAGRIRPVSQGGWRKRCTIAAIEPSRVTQTQCIRVTHPDQLYVTDNFIVTHNTSLATNIAEAVALKYINKGRLEGGFVHFFSQEMSAEQLASRVISHHARVPSDLIGRGAITDQQFRDMMDAAVNLGDMPIMVDQSGGLSIAQLSARARRIKRKHNTGLIVVDYLQLMYGSSKENRTQDLTRITNGLKALAKELMVPIIALSQLSRAVEQREEKRPTLSDLRESGSIEQDADIVMFVYREEYYALLKKPNDGDMAKLMEWQTAYDKVKGKAEVIIGKHRHGPTGQVNLAFISELTSFANLAR